jgi:hypothetical protein
VKSKLLSLGALGIASATLLASIAVLMTPPDAFAQANVNQGSQATQRGLLNVNVGNVGVAADVCANANVIGSDVSQSANC